MSYKLAVNRQTVTVGHVRQESQGGRPSNTSSMAGHSQTAVNLPAGTVENILRKYQEGSSKDFDVLLSGIADPNIEDDLLIAYLKQFKECITILSKDFETVVSVILKLGWLDRGYALGAAYQSFMLHLVSAHPVYLRACLRAIVKHFIINVDKNATIISRETRLEHENRFYKLQWLLLRIAEIVPMTPVVLIPLLAEYFPFMNKSTYQHEVYVMNLLQITKDLPAERTKILSIIVDRMAKLDARAPRASIEKEEEDDDSDDEATDVQFDMDDIDATDGKSEQTKETSLTAPSDGEPMKHEEADRLDVMLDVMFRYIHSTCCPGGNLDWVVCKKLYLDLLSVFDKIVLPSHALCHTQFILFYICSFKEELTMGFLDFLWKKVSAPLTEIIFRQIAISYMGSLLARAKYISLRLVISTLDVVMEWVHKYVTEAAYTTSKADISHHGTFYAVCQAVFYVIIFRQKNLFQSSKGHKYVQQLNLQTVVTSRLNPLKFCLPIIVTMFSNTMRQHQLVFCDTIIERNRRSILTVEGDADSIVNPLDTFFPFDPYLLSRSGRFIKPMYQEYEGTPATTENTVAITQEELETPMEAESFGTPGGKMLAMSPSVPIVMSPSTDFLMSGTSPGFMWT